MSLARVAVLFLRLMSLCSVLLSGIIVICPFLLPEEIPDSAAKVFDPGCFSAFFFVTLLPLSMIPAAIAWVIQEKNVKPRQDAERIWREGALLREERLWVWIRYVTDIKIRDRKLCNTYDTSRTPVLQVELPRALRELDRGRQARLLKFLQEIGSKEAREEINPKILHSTLDAEPTARLPRRGLVMVAAGAFALLSGFFLLWDGLALVTLLFANPVQELGMGDGRLGELVPALSAPFIFALVCGLASAGLRRLYRQAVRSLEEANKIHEVTERVILAGVQGQVEEVERWEKASSSYPESELLAQQIIRATVSSTISELDGLYRAKLLGSLYKSGWLSGEKAIPVNGVDLRAVELGGISLPYVCLSGADLSGADLNNSDLSGADLRRCTLCGSDLRSANLEDANLCGADLRYSRFQKANLERADLRSVLLDGANFWGATLAGAKLSGSQGKAEFIALAADDL